MEEAQTFQEALCPHLFAPSRSRGGMFTWEPPPLLELFLLKTMCCSTHTWDLPDHALKGHACETAPVLPQPGRQGWVPLPPTVGPHRARFLENACEYTHTHHS